MKVSGLKPGVNYTLKAYAVEFFGKRSTPLTVDITTTGERTYYRTGDVNQDGSIDTADMTALNAALAMPSAYNSLVDLDNNGVNDSRDITALQAMLDAVVITYPESDDLLDHVSKVTLTNVGTSDSYQPVAYGTGIETGVVNGDSNQSVKTWTTNRIGWAVTKIYFDEPVDLSGYTHLAFDTLFENEYSVTDSYLKRYLSVSLISGYQGQTASFGSMNFDKNETGWDTKTLSLTGLKNVDLTAVTGISFSHNFEYYEGRFDGVTEHAIYWDNLRGVVIEGADADMLSTSTVSGGQNVYGAGYTNNTNVAIQSTGGSLDVVWATEKVLNDYAAFAVDMWTPVKTTVNVQPIDAAGNLLGTAVAVTSCNIYQNKKIATSGFAVEDGVTAAGLRFTYTCGSLLLDNMNAQGAKDFDLIGTASSVEAVGGDKLTMVVTTEGGNNSNNCAHVFTNPGTGVWSGGAKLIYDEPLDLSENHYLRFDLKIRNTHRDLYLSVLNSQGEVIFKANTLRVQNSYGSDGTGTYVTYEVDLLGTGATVATAEQLKDVAAIVFSMDMASAANPTYGGVNDENAVRQYWLDNVYAVNPMEDFLGAKTTLTGPTHVQDGFICEIMPVADNRTNVIHWYADPAKNAGTTSGWPGTTIVSFTKDVVLQNHSGYTNAYDYLEFDMKTTGIYMGVYITVRDADGNKLGGGGEYWISQEHDWTTYRMDAAFLGMSAADFNKIGQVEFSFNWKHQDINGSDEKKIADVYVDNFGLRSISADSTDLLDQLTFVDNEDWWTGKNGKHTGGGWKFQSDVTAGSDDALMFYRSETSQNISNGNKTLYMYFLEPIAVESGWELTVDAIKHNYNASGAKVQIIGSDGTKYDLFSFTHTEAGVHTYSTLVETISGFDPAATTIKGLYFTYPMNPDSSMDASADGYLVLDNFKAGEPAPKDEDDFLFHATCASAQNQTAFTNNSLSAWKLIPTAEGWTYPVITLAEGVDISNHKLVMDIYPVGMTDFRMNRAQINGQWCETAGIYYDVDQWTTVSLDLASNGKDITTMTAFTLGIETYAAEGAENVALYIDNVRLVNYDDETVEPEPTDPPVVEESIADDWIKLPIDSGACYGTVSVDTEHTYGNSSQSLKYIPTGSHYFAFNPAAAKNNGDLESLDLTGGTLSWYVYFGDQEAKGQICLGNGGTYTNEPYVTYTAVGDGWYKTEVVLSELTSAANVTPNVTRIYLYFPVGYTVWIDQLTFTPGQTEPEPTEPEPTEPEPTEPPVTEPPVDGGDMLGKATLEWNPSAWNGSSASYDSSSTTVNGENSEKSWKFYTTVEGTGSIGAQLKLNQYFDGNGKDLVFDMLVDNAQNSMSIEMWNGWSTISSAKIPVNVYGSRSWQTVVVSAADIQAVYGDADMSQIFLIRFNMNLTANDASAERAIYIDNVRFVEPGTVQPNPAKRDDGDLLANTNHISYDTSHWTEENGLSCGVEFVETFNNDSWRSWRFSATADANKSSAVAQLNLNSTYDLTNAYLAYDVKFVSSDVTDIISIGTRPDDAGWAAMASIVYTNVAAGDWRTVVIDFNSKVASGQTMDDMMLLSLYFDFSTTTGAERTVYIDNLRIVPGVETFADDEIHMNVDTGSTGVKYWLSDRYTYGENSTVSMYMWADTTNNAGVSGKGVDMYYSPESGKNTIFGGKLPDYTHGVLSGYFYFGDQEPYATWNPVYSGWKGTLASSFHFKDLGDGWYLGTVSGAWISTNSASNPFAVGEAIRSSINFKSGIKVYVDDLHFLPNDTVEADWTNMILDSGATKGDYRMDTEVTYGDSKASLYFNAATGTNLVLNPQSATGVQNARLAACNIANGTVSWYVYFGDQPAAGSVQFTDAAWKNNTKAAVAYESVGDGWYKGSVDTSALTYPDGYDATKIIRIYLIFAQGGEYYVDQMTFTPHPAPLSDLIAENTGITFPTAVQENFVSETLATTDEGRENVVHLKALADNGLANSNWVGGAKINFTPVGDTADLTAYNYLSLDYKQTGIKYSLYAAVYDSNGTQIGNTGEIRATNGCDWITHRVDFTTMGLTTEELKTAAMVDIYLSWDYNSLSGSKQQDGEIYIDNVYFGCSDGESSNLLDRVVRTKSNNGTASTVYTNAGAYFDEEGGYVLKRGAGSTGWWTQQLYFDAPITVAAGTTISADFVNTGFHHGYSVSLIGSDGNIYKSIAPNADGDQSKSLAVEGFKNGDVAFDPATVNIVGIHISFSFGTCHSNPDDYATLTIKNLIVTPPAA